MLPEQVSMLGCRIFFRESLLGPQIDALKHFLVVKVRHGVLRLGLDHELPLTSQSVHAHPTALV